MPKTITILENASRFIKAKDAANAALELNNYATQRNKGNREPRKLYFDMNTATQKTRWNGDDRHKHLVVCYERWFGPYSGARI